MVARRKVRRRRVVKKASKKTTKTATKKKAVIKTKTVDGKVRRFNLTALETKLTKKCVHQGWNYYWNSQRGKQVKGTEICTDVGNKLLEALMLGIEVDKKYLGKYFNYIFSRGNSYWSQRYKCCNNNKAKLSKIVDGLMEHYIPTLTVLKKVGTYNDGGYFNTLKSLKKNSKFKKFDKKFTLYMIDKLFKHCCSKQASQKTKLDFILNNSVVDQDIFNLMLECRSPIVKAQVVNKIKDNSYKKYLSKESLYSACKLLPESSDLVEMIIKNGFQIDSKCLDVVCEWCDENAIQYVLEYKIPAEKQHFRLVVESKKYYPEKNSHGRKIGASYKRNGFNMAKAELLFRSGYRMDREDIVYTINQRVEISDIERFGISLDNEIYDICHKNKFYPKYKFDLVNREMLELQKLCNGRALTKIKKFIETNDIKPDDKCLEIACTLPRNYEIISYLIDQGCNMDISCVKNFMHGLTYGRSTKILNKIIDNFENNMNQMLGDVKKDTDSNLIINEQESESEYEGDDSDYISVHTDDLECSDYIDLGEEFEEEDEDEIITVEPEKIKKGNDYEESGLIEIDGIADKEIDDIMESIKVLDIDTSKTKPPKQLGRRVKIPKLYASYFEKENGDKMSFVSVKKEFLEHVQTNNWINPKNEKLINLPKDLRSKLGLQENGFIDFNDLDKVVRLFYK